MPLIQKRAASGPAGRAPSAMRFKYQARTAEEVKARANRSIGSRDSYLASEVDFFTPKPSDNTVRILPPTWDGAKHYGLDLHIHYGIGPDKAAYLCLDKMRGDKCPICEERAEVSAQGGDDAEALAKQLRPRQRVLVWVINRSEPNKGPLAWSMPAGLDKDIVNCSIDKSTGEILAIDDPTATGYDIAFKREGTDERTKYTGIQVARKPSPLSDDGKQADAWLEFVANHPLDSLLTYHEYEAVKAAYAGTVAEAPRSAAAAAPAAGGAPAPRNVPKRGAAAPAQAAAAAAPADSAELPSWEEVHAMTEADIEALLTAFEVDTADCNVADGPNALNDLADYACGKLEIAAPAPVETAPTGGARPSWKDRLKNMKKS